MRFKISDLVAVNMETLKAKDDVFDVEYADTGSVTAGIFGPAEYFESLRQAPSRARRVAMAGDTVYSTVRPNQRHFGFITNKLANRIYSTGFAVLHPNPEKVLPYYFYLIMNQEWVTETLQSVGSGSTSAYPSIRPGDILNLEVEVPDLETQRRIVNIFQSLDGKMLVNNQINDNLFELSKILFEAVLEDDRSELTNLANLTDIQNGFAFKSREYIGFSDTPIVRTLNIGADNLFDMQNLKYISDESRTKYQKFEFKTFDTALVMVGASIGKTGFVTSRTNGGLQNQNMWRFRPLNSEMPGLYIYNLVTYANSQMQGYKTGSAREFYTKDAFKNFEVPVGNADIYKAFFAIQDLLDNNASQTTTLTAMRDEILTQVMA